MPNATPVRRSVGVIVFTLLLIAAITALFLLGTELIGAVEQVRPSAFTDAPFPGAFR
jgi:uncharacterized BrkB/YihY/UPF0761 family membrane protein